MNLAPVKTCDDVASVIAATDWAATPLGSRDTWPDALRNAVDLILECPLAMVILWGKDLIQIYNDAYAAIAAERHPAGLGQPTRLCWPEIWAFNEPIYRDVLRGRACTFAGQKLRIERPDGHRDIWFDLTYSPIRHAGAVAGILVTVVETTAQVQTEAALRESEQRVRLAAQAAQIGTWDLDLVRNRGQWDAAALRVSGMPPERSVYDGQTWLALAHPDERDRLRTAFESSLAPDGPPYQVEFRGSVPAADGGVRWLTSHGVVLREPGSGRALRAIGVVRDVTTRRRSQEALKESEARFRVLSDTIPAFVWFASPDGDLLYLNDRWSQYTGQTSEEALPHGWVETLHPEDRERTLAAWSSARAQGTDYDVELRYRRYDGVYRWHVARAVPMRNEAGRITAWFGMSSDIDDRKRTEDGLHRLNRTLEQRVAERTADRDRIWRLSTDVMLVAGFDGTIAAVNPAWTTLLGWQAAELVGSSFLDLMHPDDCAAGRTELRRLAQGFTTLRFESRIRLKIGGYRWLSWAVVPGDGLVHGVGRDVTAEKEAAETLARTEEQLRQAQKMEAVGQLTGGMAHDFNNLLQAMQASLQLVARRAGHVEGLGPILDAGRQAVDRGAKLVRQLMAFSRRQDLRPEPVDVRDRLLGMRDLFERGLRADLRLEFDLAPGLWPVLADPVQFELAVLNLVVNARDAMPRGGQVIVGARNEAKVPGPDGRPADFVRVCVKDEGVGMPPAVAARAFEPFFTTKGPGQGTGLGLAQVYGFCRQSGGLAGMDSREGQGTTVFLLLPRSFLEPARPESDATAIAIGRTARILLVEDDLTVAPVVKAALEELGYRVEQAGTGEQALARLQAGDLPDLLVTDVVMPGRINGVDLARAAQRLRPGLPVLLTSGYSEDVVGAEGFRLVPKPYRVEELATAIARELDPPA